MAGFSNIICTKNYVIGPKCREKILESAVPEQKDCLDNAKLGTYSEFLSCAQQKESARPIIIGYNPCGGDKEGTSFGPVNLAPCYDYLDIRRGLACFCTGLNGAICTTCRKITEPEEPPETEDPDDESRKERVVERRLASIGVPNSEYGIPIPKVFGTISVSSNIIWLGEFNVSERITRLVSGDTVTITIEEIASVDFALGVCEGEIGAISRIWLDDVLVYNNTSGVYEASVAIHNQEMYDAGFHVEIHKGSEGQRINTTMAAKEGFGRTPAYRDMCYILFHNYPLAFNNANLPTVTIEVVNDIDTTTRVFQTSDTSGSVIPNVFGVDSVSLRAATDGGIWFDLLDLTFDTIPEIDGATSLQITDQGDFLITPDDNNIKMVSGRIRDESATLALANDGGFIAAKSFDGTTKIVLAREDDIFVSEWIVDDLSLSLTASYTAITSGSMAGVLAGNFSFGTSTEADFKYVAIASETGQLRFFVGDFVTDPVEYTLPLAGSYVDAMTDETTGSIILWTQEGPDIVVRQLRFSEGTIETVWISYADAYVSNGSAHRFFPGIRRYDYVTSDSIYSMNLDTGEINSIGSILNAPTPSSPLSQYYDGQRGYVLYTTDSGEVCKLYPDTRVGTGANLQNALEYMDESVQAPTLSSVVFEGYLLLDQASAAEAIEELVTFFNLIPVNTGSEIKVTSISASSVISVDEDSETAELVETRGQIKNDVTGISVMYYGENGEDTQIVRRDVLAEFDDYVANIEDQQHVIPIATTALIARQAAERILLRALQREERVDFNIAPSLLELEPGDYVFDEDTRVSEINLGGDLVGDTLAVLDAKDIYTSDPGLDGISSTPDNDGTVLDDKPPLRSFPVLFNYSPSENDVGSEQIYAGLLNPDDTPFVPVDLYLRNQNGVFIYIGTPTEEMSIGRLTTPADDTTIPHTTDNTSEMVIEFYKDVSDRVQNLTHDELRESTQSNLLIVGQEIMQYTSAEVDVDNVTVTFQGLVRGLFGTHEFTNNHSANELCILYSPESVLTPTVLSGTSSLTLLADNGGLSRSLDADFETFLDKEWGPGGLWIRKVSGDGIWFRLPSTIPYISTFENDYVFLDPRFATYVFILKAPFDEGTFLTKFAEGGFPYLGNPVANTNDYIARAFQYIGPNAEGLGEYVYDISDIVSDGFVLDGEFDFAVAVSTELDTPILEGSIYGYHFEAEADYDLFRTGLKVV